MNQNQNQNQITNHIVVKTSVDSAVRNPEAITRIRFLVMYIHILVTHGYAFCQYMFMSLLNENTHIHSLINEHFFFRVLVGLAGYTNNTGGQIPATRGYDTTIERFLNTYSQMSGYQIPRLSLLQNILKYEATKIATSYNNMIKQNFGKSFNKLINTYVNYQQRRTAIVTRINQENPTMERQDRQVLIRQAVRTELSNPLTQLRRELIRRNPVIDNVNATFHDVFATVVELVHQSYADNYTFGVNDSILYDCVANPNRHLRTYFLINRNFETRELRHNKSFPLRTSFSPKHITIDPSSLTELCGYGQQILRNLINAVYRTENREFRSSGSDAGVLYNFHGVVMTDGYSISIIKQNNATNLGGNTQPADNDPEFKYINHMTTPQLQALGNNIVFIDPGRRDLLYMMHIGSTVNDKRVLRFTSSTSREVSNRNKAAKRRTAAVENGVIPNIEIVDGVVRTVQNEDGVAVQLLLDHLSGTNHNTTVLANFQEYIQMKQNVRHLYNFFSGFLETRHGVLDTVPLFRKLQLKAYYGKVREGIHIRNEIHWKFGGYPGDIVIIIGNWSAPNVRYQIPIKGVGMRRLLAKDFPVYLINEYKTSSVCPLCDGEVEEFLNVPNPRTQHNIPIEERQARPGAEDMSLFDVQALEEGQVRCHGLHRCTDCFTDVRGFPEPRLWNRDQLAVLNFRRIYQEHLAGRGRPQSLDYNQ